MNSSGKITILARGRRKKKSKASTGRSGMLKVVMKMLSGDKSEKFVNAVTGGDPDSAKAIWSSIGDDLYQAVEMIRDEKANKGRTNEGKQKDPNTKPEQNTSSKSPEQS